MKLRILGSGSSGNCYILYNENESLILDCGVKFDKIIKGINYNVFGCAGCLVTHEHNDHASTVEKIIKASIPVYCSQGTAEAKGIENIFFTNILKPYEQVEVGNFIVMPIPAKHDCKEPFAYIIKHPECGVVLFATDTYYLEDKVVGLNNILIECNYCDELLDANSEAGIVSISRRNRVIKSHMSLNTCISTLKANDLSQVNRIILIHLSNDNMDKKLVTEIEREIGRKVLVARKGLDIDFNRKPF